MSITYKEIADRTGTAIPDHLEAQATPKLEAWAEKHPRRQGDVLYAPADRVVGPNGAPVNLTGRGHKVVEGEADRNSHILNGDGTFHPVTGNPIVYGYLEVPDGGEAVLTHTSEHGSHLLGPGVWKVWSQINPATMKRLLD